MRFRLSVLFFLVGCAGADLAPGNGEGIVAFDRAPPTGATLFERPVWTAGDRFAYRRGGKLAVSYRVRRASAEGYALVEQGTGLVLELTPDLAETSRGVPGNPRARRVRDPADHDLSWPLWVGKRWSYQYLEKRPGAAAAPVRVDCRCEAEETIETSFGATFRCLRILRTARLELAGRTFLDKTSLLYYSPKVGWFARRIEEGVLFELEAYHRQRRP